MLSRYELGVSISQLNGRVTKLEKTSQIMTADDLIVNDSMMLNYATPKSVNFTDENNFVISKKINELIHPITNETTVSLNIDGSLNVGTVQKIDEFAIPTFGGINLNGGANISTNGITSSESFIFAPDGTQDTQSTDVTTGLVTIYGGIGVLKNVSVGETINFVNTDVSISRSGGDLILRDINTGTVELKNLGSQCTRLLSGGDILPSNGNNSNFTSVNVSSGTGKIWDSATGQLSNISWDESDNVPLNYLGTSPISYFMISYTNGVISLSQTNIEPYGDVLRKNIYLAKIIHPFGNAGIEIINCHWYADEPFVATAELSNALGYLCLSGNEIKQNGTDMSLDKTEGTTYCFQTNSQDRQNPTIIYNAPLTQMTLTRCYLSPNLVGETAMTIDPSAYNGNNAKMSVPSGYWQIQRVFHSPLDNKIYVMYGQKLYPTKEDALSHVSDSYTTNDFLEKNVFRCAIILKNEGTILNDSNSVFINMTKFESSTTLKKIPSVIETLGLPGVIINKNYLTPTLTGVDVVQGCGYIRNSSSEIVYKEWENMGLNYVSFVLPDNGNMGWITLHLDSNDEIVPDIILPHSFPTQLSDLEKYFVIGRIWKSNGIYYYDDTFINTSLDIYVSRSECWNNPTRNMSVMLNYYVPNATYLSMTSGDLFIYPCVTGHSLTWSAGSHIHTYAGEMPIMKMFGHLWNASNDKFDDISDTTVTNLSQYYDNGTSIVGPLTNGEFTIHRVGIWNNVVVWFRGQNIYNTLNDAIDAVANEPFKLSVWAQHLNSPVFIAFVILKSGATSFNDDTSVKILPYSVGNASGIWNGGNGNVFNNTASTDNAIARFDGTSGMIIQDSNVEINDSGSMHIKSTIDGTDMTSGALLVDGGIKLGGNLAMNGEKITITHSTGEFNKIFRRLTTGIAIDYNDTQNVFDLVINRMCRIKIIVMGYGYDNSENTFSCETLFIFTKSNNNIISINGPNGNDIVTHGYVVDNVPWNFGNNVFSYNTVGDTTYITFHNVNGRSENILIPTVEIEMNSF